MSQFLSIKAVCAQIGISRGTLYRLVLDGDFPSPIMITARRTVFNADAVEQWMQDRESRAA